MDGQVICSVRKYNTVFVYSVRHEYSDWLEAEYNVSHVAKLKNSHVQTLGSVYTQS